MAPDVTLVDASKMYAEEVGRMCAETVAEGVPWTERELLVFAAEVAPLFDMCWADFMQWADHGDDQRAKTRDVIRASLKVASMWDGRNWR